MIDENRWLINWTFFAKVDLFAKKPLETQSTLSKSPWSSNKSSPRSPQFACEICQMYIGFSPDEHGGTLGLCRRLGQPGGSAGDHWLPKNACLHIFAAEKFWDLQQVTRCFLKMHFLKFVLFQGIHSLKLKIEPE